MVKVLIIKLDPSVKLPEYGIYMYTFSKAINKEVKIKMLYLNERYVFIYKGIRFENDLLANYLVKLIKIK